MANQPETTSYDVGVYQIETTDAVVGGVGGIANKSLLNLANRTNWLNDQFDLLGSGGLTPAWIAPLASPTFTGTAAAPTPAVGDNTTKIATTAFVQETAHGLVSLSVAGNSNVALTQAQWGLPIVVLTGALTGNINVIFPTQAGEWIVVNATTGAFVITCKTAAGTGVAVPRGASEIIYGDGTNIVAVQAATVAGSVGNLQGFTTSGSFVVPVNVTKVKVRVVGGGGSGAGGQPTAGGGGGGGGGYAEGVYTVTPGATIAVTIGGVAAGVAAGAGGGEGQTCSFGSLVSATGGFGGTPTASGGGGSGSGGQVNATGGGGGVNFGSANGADGGAPASLGSAGTAAATAGGYGAGSAGGGANSNSGDATQGIVIVEW